MICKTVIAALVLAAAALGSPALADGMVDDGPGPGYGRSPGMHAPMSRGWVGRPRHAGRRHGAISIEAAGYGPPPPVVSHHAEAGPILVEYREPYLPRGVLYNVPPPPTWAVSWRRGAVVRALN